MRPACVPSAETDRDARVYTFGDDRLLVDVEEPDAARWVSEFVTPWFGTDTMADAEMVVRMSSSAELVAELTGEQARATVQPVPCFRLDRGVASYPGWIDADGCTVAADTDWGCFYRVRPRVVEVIARPGDRLARIGLMRVVRELLTARTARAPAVVELHAAALTYQRRAVLLAGGRRRGKTTLLAHALASGDAALMANDRVIVDSRSRLAVGVPTVVAVRDGTERAFPALGRALPRRATLLHAAELSRPDDRSAASGSRLVLSPGQFAAQLAAGVEPHATLSAIVFPEVRPEQRGWSLEPVAREEGVERLREALYALVVDPPERTIFCDTPGPSPDEDLSASRMHRRQEAVERLAATVSMARLVVGRDAYAEGADWLRLLSDAAESSRG